MNFLAAFRVLLAFALLAPFATRADEVDDYVKTQMNQQHIPGLALAVVKNGHIEKSAGYGLANVELNVPVRTDTVFQIQSITKTFTASAVMLLVEEGKIGLDDKITKHLDGLPESWKEITVRHLLSHTSGIKDFINEPTVDMRKDIQPEDVIESLRNLPLNFPPGEKYAYSNTGYHLLAMIIRKITGQYWGEYLKDRIPLKRPGQPNDLDGAVVFLASDASEYVTGQTLLVDGGISTGAVRALASQKKS